VQLTVTVQREELVIERSAIANTQAAGPAIQAAPLVVVLREEVPVVTLEVQPYARAHLSIVQVAGEQDVTTTVDSEQIQLHVPGR
jgi:stress response protein YsnF